MENSTAPKFLSVDEADKVLYQLKYSVCQVCEGEKYGTGFFALLPNKKNPANSKVFVTCNKLLGRAELKITKTLTFSLRDNRSNQKITLGNQRNVFTNAELDLTVVEIKDEDNLDVEFLKFDEAEADSLQNQTVYLLHYPKVGEAAFSLGKVAKTADQDLFFTSNSENESAGGPVLLLPSFKVVAMLKGVEENLNLGKMFKALSECFNDDSKNQVMTEEEQKAEEEARKKEEEAAGAFEAGSKVEDALFDQLKDKIMELKLEETQAIIDGLIKNKKLVKFTSLLRNAVLDRANDYVEKNFSGFKKSMQANKVRELISKLK